MQLEETFSGQYIYGHRIVIRERRPILDNGLSTELDAEYKGYLEIKKEDKMYPIVAKYFTDNKMTSEMAKIQSEIIDKLCLTMDYFGYFPAYGGWKNFKNTGSYYVGFGPDKIDNPVLVFQQVKKAMNVLQEQGWISYGDDVIGKEVHI